MKFHSKLLLMAFGLMLAPLYIASIASAQDTGLDSAAGNLIYRRLDLDESAMHANEARTLAEESRGNMETSLSAMMQAIWSLYSGQLADTEPIQRIVSISGGNQWTWLPIFGHGIFTGDDSEVSVGNSADH